jgi:hypothetical protein
LAFRRIKAADLTAAETVASEVNILTTSTVHADDVAILCHMRDGFLQRYDSEYLHAADDADAIRKATVWRVTAAATIDERTWMQVLVDDLKIHSEELGIA